MLEIDCTSPFPLNNNMELVNSCEGKFLHLRRLTRKSIDLGSTSKKTRDIGQQLHIVQREVNVD